MPDDFYDLLGVSEDASADEVRRSFRELARQYHPDVNDDARATAQFKTLRTAYEVLSDPEERATYDRLGHAAYVDRHLDGLPTSEMRAAKRASQSTSARSASSASTSASTSTSTGAASSGRATGNGRTARTGRRAGRRRHRRPRRGPRLEVAWAGVALAGVVYAVGLAQYLGAADGLAAALATDPVGTLAGGAGLPSPSGFARAAAAAPSLDLLFPVGALVLPLVLGWTVLRFGRGVAWLYVLGSLGPAVALTAGPVVPVPPVTLLVVLLVAVPSLATLAFLGDVGRFVVAARRAT
jgi:hypothetical protein